MYNECNSLTFWQKITLDAVKINQSIKIATPCTGQPKKFLLTFLATPYDLTEPLCLFFLQFVCPDFKEETFSLR